MLNHHPPVWGTEPYTQIELVPRAIVKRHSGLLAANAPLFRITGGPILVTMLVGRVLDTIGAGPVTAQINEVVVDPAGTVAMSTAVAVATDAIGTTYTFTAAAPGVLTPTTAGALANVPVERWLCPPGDIVCTASADEAGDIEWTMVYEPLSPDSQVYVL